MNKECLYKLSVFSMAISSLFSECAWASLDDKEKKEDTIVVKAILLDPDDSRFRTSVSASKIPLRNQDIPQTVETIDVSKMKLYGINDLNIMLNGIAGVNTKYDMRGDGVSVRGFDASYGDIYRDGIRASGQIRRSTANVERIEVLKGPASVLYGRGSGGGIVNLISKAANFNSPSSLNIRAGEWNNRGTTIDVNQILNDYVAIRITADKEHADSFRKNTRNKNKMIAPSILFDNQNGLTLFLQYNVDEVWRHPDRPPTYDNIPGDVPRNIAYAHPNDFVKDKMTMWRSIIGYTFENEFNLKWTSAYHSASQDFDHFYSGRYCQPDGKFLSDGKSCNMAGSMTFTRAWQQTRNSTLTNMVDFTGKMTTGILEHQFLLGSEYSIEKRIPKFATSASGSDLSLGYTQPINPYNPVWNQAKTSRNQATTHNQHEATTYAVYLQDLVSFNSQWKIMAGLRFERYTFSSHNKITDRKNDYSGNLISPRLGLIWQPTETHSFYTSYSKNFSPYGGRGMISGVNVSKNAVFDSKPQYSEQYEIGIKSDWLKNRFSSQISIYSLEHYNIRYQPDKNRDPYHWAIKGKERSQGLEFSLNGQLFSDWYIRSSIGYQESKIIQNKEKKEQEGKYKPDLSKVNGSFYLRYVPYQNLYLEVGTVFKSSFFNNEMNLSKRSGYSIYNSAVGYRTNDWAVSIAVNNMTNKNYWRSRDMPGDPRSFLISANYFF